MAEEWRTGRTAGHIPNDRRPVLAGRDHASFIRRELGRPHPPIVAAKRLGTAITQIPEAGGVVVRAGEQAFAIAGESHRQHGVGMALQAAQTTAITSIPQRYILRFGGRADRQSGAVGREGDGEHFRSAGSDPHGRFVRIEFHDPHRATPATDSDPLAVAGNVEGFERGVGSDGAFVAEAQIA